MAKIWQMHFIKVEGSIEKADLGWMAQRPSPGRFVDATIRCALLSSNDKTPAYKALPHQHRDNRLEPW